MKKIKVNYKGSNVVIIGVGITGLSCINFFLSLGVTPKIIDTRIYPPNIKKIPSFIECYFGGLYDKWILNANLIVVSPGIKLDHPIFIEAIKIGIEIIGDIELFLREVSVPVIAITGSNGKSTVTQLVGNMARFAGLNVGIAGNIGIPALTLLNKQYELYILEMSSFQLDVTYSLHAIAATILNISVDHMDRYPGGFKQYNSSKQKIYHNAITCVTNASDPLTKPILNNYTNLVSFGIYSNFADYRLEFYKKSMWIVAFNRYVLDCAELPIQNNTNYNNILSALALSDSIKIPRIASLKALRCFYGLPHRFQLVYKYNNISWINDSKSTNVASTIEAIKNTVLTLSGRLHLLLGGDGKLANFMPIAPFILKYRIHLYCFGKDGEFLTTLGSNNIVLTKYMADAIRIISRCVVKKDIVLLSPACSSLDQFISFENRGKIFIYLSRKFSLW